MAREPSAQGLGRRAEGRAAPVTAPGVTQPSSCPSGAGSEPGEVKTPAHTTHPSVGDLGAHPMPHALHMPSARTSLKDN